MRMQALRLLGNVPMHLVYPSRRNLAPRTHIVMDFVIEQALEITLLLDERERGIAELRLLRLASLGRSRPVIMALYGEGSR
jgi:hypothetical protein